MKDAIQKLTNLWKEHAFLEIPVVCTVSLCGLCTE